MFTRELTAVCALALGLLGAAESSAQDPAAPTTEARPARFGQAGQWAFSTDASINIHRRTQRDVEGAVTSLVIVPAADYFVTSGFSAGGFLGLTYSKTGDTRSTRFELGPRVGYNFTLSERWSVWPKLGFSYAYTGGSGADQNALALNIFAPFVFHPAAHFFVGFGPFVDVDLNGDHAARVWGAKLTLGGWL